MNRVHGERHCGQPWRRQLCSTGEASGKAGAIQYDGYSYGVLNNTHARLWDNLQTAITNAFSQFPQRRGSIKVYAATSGGSFYHHDVWPFTNEYIQINTTNGVWGDYGRFTEAHEFGHAFHHEALGGYPNLPSSCDSHTWYSDEDESCAYVEGFADFFGVQTANDVAGWKAYVESNGPREQALANGITNGARVEGEVAAFLLDVMDGANESWDSIAYPGSYLSGIVQTCSVQLNGSWYHAFRIEDAVFCMEGGVDPAITNNGTYFPGQPTPTAVYEQTSHPPGWQQFGASLRQLWTHNLYGVN